MKYFPPSLAPRQYLPSKIGGVLTILAFLLNLIYLPNTPLLLEKPNAVLLFYCSKLIRFQMTGHAHCPFHSPPHRRPHEVSHPRPPRQVGERGGVPPTARAVAGGVPHCWYLRWGPSFRVSGLWGIGVLQWTEERESPLYYNFLNFVRLVFVVTNIFWDSSIHPLLCLMCFVGLFFKL